MDFLLQLLSSYIEDETALRLVFSALVGAAIFAICASVYFLLAPFYSPTRRRLSEISHDGGASGKGGDAGTQSEALRAASAKLDSITGKMVPKGGKGKSSIEKQLLHAGYRSERALNIFYSAKTLSLMLLGFLALLLSSRYPEWSVNRKVQVVAVALYIGFILPNMLLDYLERKRVTAIRRGFPDALDLFVVCVESGLGLPATIQRVGAEIEVSHPELSEELKQVTAEMRVGVDRIVALRGLAERSGMDEIKGLVTMIDQSARFGTGIAETLRVFSDEFRDRRMQAAEEKAAKIGTKMIFPLILCIWPSFFVVAVGPAVLILAEMFRTI